MTHPIDLKKGLAITHALHESAAAPALTLALARLFGDGWRLEHLGCVHRLSRWRGRWYHTGIWKAE